MAENSVHGLLWELATAIENLLEGWDDNLDGVDLNELDANKYYPFHESLDEIYTDVINWAEEVEEEIASNTFDAKGKIDTSHIHLFDSMKESKKLNETWAGEDVISNLIDRAKSMIDDGDDLDDAVQRALDDGLIYTKDIRTLAEHYDVLPSDGELVSMFYEELYGDVYNEASDYYDEVHEDDDEDFEESYRRVKSLVEKRGEKFVYDEDDLVVEVQKLKDVYKKKGADALAGTPFKTIRLKYPNFTKWFEKYHVGMEGNDDGELDENSTPIAEYWEVMDDVDFDSLFDFIDHRGKQIPIKYYMKHASSYDSGLDETEDMKELIQTGQIQMANGGK